MTGERTATASLEEGIRYGREPGARDVHGERTSRALRLLVVDDHPAVRLGLVGLLADQADFEVVSVAETGERAVAEAERRDIDVAIVDYHLGGRNGLWVCRKLKRFARPPRVIVFSAYASDHLAANCAVAHADGLLNKGALGSELCDAVRAVAHGRRLLGKLPQQLLGTLRRRLYDSEQLLFGMLLAGLSAEEIVQVLDVSAHELALLEDAILFKLEALPGEDTDPRPRRVAERRAARTEPPLAGAR